MWNIEVTDTFGGEANYCWVRRYSMPSIEGEKQAQVMRRAKALAGYAGVRGSTTSLGEGYEFRPSGMCRVMFVTWTEPEYAFQSKD